MQYFGHTYTKKSFIIHLKFRFGSNFVALLAKSGKAGSRGPVASCGLALTVPQGASLSGEEQMEPTRAYSVTAPKPALYEQGADGASAFSVTAWRGLSGGCSPEGTGVLQSHPCPLRGTVRAGSQGCWGSVPLLDTTSPRRRALVWERGSVTSALTESPSSGTNEEVQQSVRRRAKCFESHTAGCAWLSTCGIESRGADAAAGGQPRAPRAGRLLPGCSCPALTPQTLLLNAPAPPPHTGISGSAPAILSLQPCVSF